MGEYFLKKQRKKGMLKKVVLDTSKLPEVNAKDDTSMSSDESDVQVPRNTNRVKSTRTKLFLSLKVTTKVKKVEKVHRQNWILMKTKTLNLTLAKMKWIMRINIVMM